MLRNPWSDSVSAVREEAELPIAAPMGQSGPFSVHCVGEEASLEASSERSGVGAVVGGRGSLGSGVNPYVFNAMEKQHLGLTSRFSKV